MEEWLRRLPVLVFRRSGRAIAVVLLLALPVGCAFGGPDLQSVADEFTAPASWRVLGDAEVTETLCIGPECKTVVMAWSSRTAPTAEDFVSLMQQAGWADVEVDDCRVQPDVTGPIPFCRATATSGDAHIELTAAGPLAGEADPFRITLRVMSN